MMLEKWSTTLYLLLLLHLLEVIKETNGAVIVSGGPYCTGEGEVSPLQANINTNISINCTVTNPSNLVNLLHWSIPSLGVSISHVNANPFSTLNDNTNTDIISTVIDSNNSPPPGSNKTMTARLQLPAFSSLDGSTVSCSDVSGQYSNCTLSIKSELSYTHAFKLSEILSKGPWRVFNKSF